VLNFRPVGRCCFAGTLGLASIPGDGSDCCMVVLHGAGHVDTY
jgi:hypothetical protein